MPINDPLAVLRDGLAALNQGTSVADRAAGLNDDTASILRNSRTLTAEFNVIREQRQREEAERRRQLTALRRQLETDQTASQNQQDQARNFLTTSREAAFANLDDDERAAIENTPLGFYFREQELGRQVTEAAARAQESNDEDDIARSNAAQLALQQEQQLRQQATGFDNAAFADLADTSNFGEIFANRDGAGITGFLRNVAAGATNAVGGLGGLVAGALGAEDTARGIQGLTSGLAEGIGVQSLDPIVQGQRIQNATDAFNAGDAGVGQTIADVLGSINVGGAAQIGADSIGALVGGGGIGAGARALGRAALSDGVRGGASALGRNAAGELNALGRAGQFTPTAAAIQGSAFQGSDLGTEQQDAEGNGTGVFLDAGGRPVDVQALAAAQGAGIPLLAALGGVGFGGLEGLAGRAVAARGNPLTAAAAQPGANIAQRGLSRLAGAGRNAVGQAASEGVQEGTEDLISQFAAAQGAGVDFDPNVGSTLAAGTLGAAIGGPAGGIAGGFAGPTTPATPNAQADQTAPELLGLPSPDQIAQPAQPVAGLPAPQALAGLPAPQAQLPAPAVAPAAAPAAAQAGTRVRPDGVIEVAPAQPSQLAANNRLPAPGTTFDANGTLVAPGPTAAQAPGTFQRLPNQNNQDPNDLTGQSSLVVQPSSFQPTAVPPAPDLGPEIAIGNFLPSDRRGGPNVDLAERIQRGEVDNFNRLTAEQLAQRNDREGAAQQQAAFNNLQQQGIAGFDPRIDPVTQRLPGTPGRPPARDPVLGEDIAAIQQSVPERTPINTQAVPPAVDQVVQRTPQTEAAPRTQVPGQPGATTVTPFVIPEAETAPEPQTAFEEARQQAFGFINANPTAAPEEVLSEINVEVEAALSADPTMDAAEQLDLLLTNQSEVVSPQTPAVNTEGQTETGTIAAAAPEAPSIRLGEGSPATREEVTTPEASAARAAVQPPANGQTSISMVAANLRAAAENSSQTELHQLIPQEVLNLFPESDTRTPAEEIALVQQAADTSPEITEQITALGQPVAPESTPLESVEDLDIQLVRTTNDGRVSNNGSNFQATNSEGVPIGQPIQATSLARAREALLEQANAEPVVRNQLEATRPPLAQPAGETAQDGSGNAAAQAAPQTEPSAVQARAAALPASPVTQSANLDNITETLATGRQRTPDLQGEVFAPETQRANRLARDEVGPEPARATGQNYFGLPDTQPVSAPELRQTINRVVGAERAEVRGPEEILPDFARQVLEDTGVPFNETQAVSVDGQLFINRDAIEDRFDLDMVTTLAVLSDPLLRAESGPNFDGAFLELSRGFGSVEAMVRRINDLDFDVQTANPEVIARAQSPDSRQDRREGTNLLAGSILTGVGQDPLNATEAELRAMDAVAGSVREWLARVNPDLSRHADIHLSDFDVARLATDSINRRC